MPSLIKMEGPSLSPLPLTAPAPAHPKELCVGSSTSMAHQPMIINPIYHVNTIPPPPPSTLVGGHLRLSVPAPALPSGSTISNLQAEYSGSFPVVDAGLSDIVSTSSMPVLVANHSTDTRRLDTDSLHPFNLVQQVPSLPPVEQMYHLYNNNYSTPQAMHAQPLPLSMVGVTYPSLATTSCSSPGILVPPGDVFNILDNSNSFPFSSLDLGDYLNWSPTPPRPWLNISASTGTGTSVSPCMSLAGGINKFPTVGAWCVSTPSPTPTTINIREACISTVVPNMKAKPLRASLYIHNTLVDFIIDTGSNLSCISETLAIQLNLPITPTDRTATVANSSPLSIIGKSMVPVQLSVSCIKLLPMYVVKSLSCYGLIGTDLYDGLFKSSRKNKLIAHDGIVVRTTSSGNVRTHVQLLSKFKMLPGGETTECGVYVPSSHMVGVYALHPNPNLPPYLHIRHAVYHLDGVGTSIPVTLFSTNPINIIIPVHLNVGHLVRVGSAGVNGSCHQVMTTEPEDVLAPVVFNSHRTLQEELFGTPSCAVPPSSSLVPSVPTGTSILPQLVSSTHGPVSDVLLLPSSLLYPCHYYPPIQH